MGCVASPVAPVYEHAGSSKSLVLVPLPKDIIAHFFFSLCESVSLGGFYSCKLYKVYKGRQDKARQEHFNVLSDH